jgi:dephospho-CoA kinase
VVVIGLIGPVAAGKSLVLAEMERLGAVTIRADDVSRALLAPGQPLLDAVFAAFGERYRRPDGSLDRRALGQLIFSDEEARARLEGILHPAMVARMAEMITAERERPCPPPAVVVEAANLAPMGGLKLVDVTVMVTAERETRVRRLMARDGMTRAEAEALVNLHEALGLEAFPADYVLVNDGDEADLRTAVQRLGRALVQEQSRAGVDELR